jgi:hypothetical protein
MQIDQKTCIRCGEYTLDYSGVTLPIVSKIIKTPPSQQLQKLCELTGLDSEAASNWFAHQFYYTRCNATEPPCPNCSNNLKTWHSKLCLHCDWQRPKDKLLKDCYEL